MSYAEVERGLPPVNVVYSPIRQQPKQTPKFLLNNEDESDREPSPGDFTNKKLKKLENIDKRKNDMSVFTANNSEDFGTLKSDENDYMSRSRKFGGFVLILLPPIFFALAIQFLTFMMEKFQFYILGLCVFQGVVWPAKVYLIFLFITGTGSDNGLGKVNFTSQGVRNIAELLMLGLISSGIILLQILSIQFIDITVPLAITFAPLVISAFILHIHREQRFPIELFLLSIISYIGIILISIPTLQEKSSRRQEDLVIGIGSSVAAMLLTIPASLNLSRIRSKQINDCITAIFFGIIGTITSIVIGITMANVESISQPAKVDKDPWKIVGLIALIFVGTSFQIFESNYRKLDRMPINLSRTRLGIFILSGIWEIIKHAFIPGFDFVANVFTVFGVILLILSYLFAASFQTWYGQSTQDFGKNLYFIPWLFSRKS